MSNIYCSDPLIIRNPKLQYLLLTYRCYCVRGSWFYLSDSQLSDWYVHFPKWRFSPKRYEVTKDNLSDFYVFDVDSGAIYPMFVEVPCGHCLLCGSRRAAELRFRAVAETSTSSVTPLMVTLTYNPKYLPKFGVSKAALQLFFKRLRIRLQRLGFDGKIKYFACSEYGKDTHRAHYHVVIWDFPSDRLDLFPNITSVLHFIEKCWSIYVYDFDRKIWIYDPIGFAYCKPCDSGAFDYVMKYVTKPCPFVPDGCNSTFYLMSHGIGSAHCDKYRDFYLSNPEKLDISVTDPINGSILTAPLPSYYVRRYFPTVSSRIPRHIRELFFQFLSNLRSRYTVVNALSRASSPDATSFLTSEFYPYLSPDERQVLDIYWPLYFEGEFSLSVDYKLDHLYHCETDERLSRLYFDYTLSLDSASSVLLAHSRDVDLQYLNSISDLRARRARSIDNFIVSSPDRDLELIERRLRDKLSRRRNSEVF